MSEVQARTWKSVESWAEDLRIGGCHVVLEYDENGCTLHIDPNTSDPDYIQLRVSILKTITNGVIE